MDSIFISRKFRDAQKNVFQWQDGITCGAIDEASRTSNAIERRVIINFRDKNAVIVRFRNQNDLSTKEALQAR